MLLPGTAPYSIPDSAVQFEAQLDPRDPALAFFDCGTDATAVAINTFFNRGAWIGHSGMVALRFMISGARLGYVAVKMSRQAHPDSTASGEAEYLAIWMMGVDRPFQGAADPGSATGSRLSDALLRGCELVATVNNAVGTSLWVRDANVRAKRLYLRNGFIVDPRGVFRDRRGIDMLEMRKNLAP